MAILQATVQVLMGAQTEIAIFIIAICAHMLLFNDHFKPLLAKFTPSKKGKNKKDASNGCPKTDHVRLPRSPNHVVARAMKQLVQQGADQEGIVHEFEYHFRACAPEYKTTMLLDTLEQVGRASTPQFIMAVRFVLQKHNLKPHGRLGELILRSLVALHMQEEFNELVAEMEGTEDATFVTATLSLRAALASSDFETAFARIRGFAAQWRESNEQTPSVAPQGLMQQVIRLAGEKGKLLYLFQEFHECKLATSRMFELVLTECVRRGEIAVMKKVEEFARSHSVEITKGALCLLVRGVDTKSEVLKFYDTHLSGIDVCADTFSAKHIAEAAFHGQRLDILEQMLAVSKDTSKQVFLLKSFATEGRMKEATKIFNICPEKNTCLYNALLDANIECRDVQAAERIMSDAIVAGMADVVTYNTMIKAHLHVGDPGRARAAVDAMQAAGLAPNSITFNELIDATAKTDVEGAWRLIGEMEARGLKPNQITCSILLKRIQHGTRAIDIERIFSFLDSIGDEMDEVLLSSTCEACVRAGRTDLITKLLSRQRTSKAVYVKGAHTYGSLIRAQGFIKDLAGAWEMWNEMLARHIVPTSITIGCMVEALVLNQDTDRGYELIRELLRGDQTRPLVNAVIYCSVLKGFSHQKRFDCVWAVYEEMLKEKIQLSIVTYNALIDACARCCQMEHVQQLLDDMCAQKIELNIWTYSTIFKGYCNDGRIEKALELFEEMKKTKELKPDEITYNTLLDGCARAGLFNRGIALLHEMENGGVPPSNFTLSVLAKLCNRSRRADKAFELCEQIAKKYNIRLNVHVYNNLIQACTSTGGLTRGLGVFEQMLGEGVRPDPRTYTILLRSCIACRRPQDAAGLLRTAVGLHHGGHPKFTGFASAMTTLRGGLPTETIEQILEGISDQCGEQELAVQLLKELRHQPGVRLNAALSVQLTSKAIKTTNRW